MRQSKMLLLICLAGLFYSCTPTSQLDPDQENWQELFNGQNLDNWTIKIAGKPLGENFQNTFVVQDSMIRIQYDEYETFDDLYGHMYYDQPFSHYKLAFDYRFVGDQTPGGASWNVRNSGIMLHSQSAESNDYGQGFPVSVELQLLGGLEDGPRTTANVCTPGTAVVMGDTVNYNHCISSSSDTYDGDQWVHAEAIVLGGESMFFIVEGDTVLYFEKPQVGGGFISAQLEGQDFDEFGVDEDKQDWLDKAGQILTEGYIALQAESHPIDFKNIQLLNLCGCIDESNPNYRSYFVKNDPKACK